MNNTSIIQPVILAGGAGSRLWPLSRHHYAKQYLPLGGDATLLQETVTRLNTLQHAAPLIVCNEETRFLAAEQMRQIGCDEARILLEPVGRNTAPAIALAALEARREGQDPVLLVMPSDHKIADHAQFVAVVEKAKALAMDEHMVTFGIVPSSPETGYGYIKRGAALGAAFMVDQFVEKPALKTAEAYLADGGYYWNSGIFVFRASRYLEALEKHRAAMAAACRLAFEGRVEDYDFLRFGVEAFQACPDESIDYAVMEHTEAAVMLPLDAGWSDIGSWAALWDISEKTAEGNCEIGDVVTLNGTGNYVHSTGRLVATLGLKDMVVVETSDAVFVAPKARVQEVKHIVSYLEGENRSEHRHHREIYRPWGKYDCVDKGDRYQVKRITVNPGAKLSVQMHKHRAEHWVVVRGTAKVLRGKETFILGENQSTYIPLGEVHALENPGTTPLELIEIQSGSYLGEDDIIRLKDRYGRV